LDTLAAEAGELQGRAEQFAADRAGAAAQQAALRELKVQVDERFELLKHAEAACPVCEETLPSEKRLGLGRKVKTEQQQIERALGAAAARQQAAEGGTAAARRRLQEIQQKLKTGESWRRQLAQAEQELANAQEAAGGLPAAAAVVA